MCLKAQPRASPDICTSLSNSSVKSELDKVGFAEKAGQNSETQMFSSVAVVFTNYIQHQPFIEKHDLSIFDILKGVLNTAFEARPK